MGNIGAKASEELKNTNKLSEDLWIQVGNISSEYFWEKKNRKQIISLLRQFPRAGQFVLSNVWINNFPLKVFSFTTTRFSVILRTASRRRQR